MSFYTQFKHSKPKAIKATGGRTQISAMQDADINLLLKKYNLSRIPPPTTAPIYADRVVLPKTLEEAQDVIETAFTWFDELPAEVRAKFENDPVKALQLVNTDLAAAMKIGLIPSTPEVDKLIAKAVKTASPGSPSSAAEATKGANATVAETKGAEATA